MKLKIIPLPIDGVDLSLSKLNDLFRSKEFWLNHFKMDHLASFSGFYPIINNLPINKCDEETTDHMTPAYLACCHGNTNIFLIKSTPISANYFQME